MSDHTPTPEQQPAIDYKGNLVAIAKPGSGKTFVLSKKVQQILEPLPSYQGVIAISFTNKASDELRNRSAGRGVDLKASFFGTIDRFCLAEITIPFLSHIWGKPNAEIEIARIRDLEEEDREVFEILDEAELTLEILEELIPQLKSQFLKGRLFLDMAGTLALYTIRNAPACQRYLKVKYTHIIIDEYQDSGLAQHQLFMLLCELGLIAIAVGDADQSIYGFSKKDSKYLLSLAKNNDFKTFPITLNHRCHPSIVNYSLRFLDQNAQLLNSNETFVYYKSCDGNVVVIADWIDSIIPQIMADFEVKHENAIGILVRNNMSGVLVNNALSVKHRLALPHALEENMSLWAIIFCDLLKFRFDTQFTAQDIIDRQNFGLTTNELIEVRKKIKAIRGCPEEELFDLMESIASVFRPNANKQGPIALLRASTHEDLSRCFTPARSDEVQIMTIHKSKGLEFDVVFHLDLYEWVFPAKRPGEGNDFDNPVYPDLDQDRNLHYVGITRARKLCLLCTSTRRINRDNVEKVGKPSEFLKENDLDQLRIGSPY